MNVSFACQCSNFAKNRKPTSEGNMKILSWFPIPLSKIKNCPLLALIWYYAGSLGISQFNAEHLLLCFNWDFEMIASMKRITTQVFAKFLKRYVLLPLLTDIHLEFLCLAQI